MQDLERAETELIAPPPSRLRALAGLAVSVVAVAGCVLWARDQDAPTLPSDAGDWALLALGVAVYGVPILVRGWRWREILRFADIKHEPVGVRGLVLDVREAQDLAPAPAAHEDGHAVHGHPECEQGPVLGVLRQRGLVLLAGPEHAAGHRDDGHDEAQ